MTEAEIRAMTVMTIKTPEQRQAEQVKKYVDEYAALSLEAQRVKERMDWLKATLKPWLLTT